MIEARQPSTASAYTPTLTIAAETTVRRVRRLPLPGEICVAGGEAVTAQQIVASTALPGPVVVLNVARELNVPPQEISRWLLKQVGDPVEQGELLAEYRTFFGFFHSQALSPARGTIEALSTITGQALIRGEPLPVELKAYLAGTVVGVETGESVTLECRCALMQGILGVGGEAYGELAFLVETPEAVVGPTALDESHRGKVLVGGAQLSYEMLQRARELGVAAVVGGAMKAADLDRLLGQPLGVAITGQERLGLTVILTEGFGRLPMAEETFALLKQHEGQSASLNGATQIRAGVLRPEIIIPLAQTSAGPLPAPSGRLAIGSRLRLVRDPYFGRLGTVTDLPHRPQVIPTEARVRVLRARLDDGREVTVPRANVELIER